MELNETESNAGVQWLIGAAVVAVIFSACLFMLDRSSELSVDRDIQYNIKLRELRLAQASLPAGSNDLRVLLPLRAGARQAEAVEASVHANDHH